mmetsp:Transcript_15694/g.28178  ORF Transcript_15694/g.28178 Transcript_15694/m.28178 type:complete len:218 (-) Transcript_15694:587-1240(-)
MLSCPNSGHDCSLKLNASPPRKLLPPPPFDSWFWLLASRYSGAGISSEAVLFGVLSPVKIELGMNSSEGASHALFKVLASLLLLLLVPCFFFLFVLLFFFFFRFAASGGRGLSFATRLDDAPDRGVEHVENDSGERHVVLGGEPNEEEDRGDRHVPIEAELFPEPELAQAPFASTNSFFADEADFLLPLFDFFHDGGEAAFFLRRAEVLVAGFMPKD